MSFTGIAIIIVILIVVVTSVKNGKKGKLSANFPPGPKPLPLIGNLLLIDRKRPQKSFSELSKKYGSVFSVQLGMKKVVLLSGYETVKDALVNHADEFAERGVVPIFEDINKGFGIPFAHGEIWRTMRRFTLSTLRDFGMGKRTIEVRIIEESEFLVNHFRSHGGKPFNVRVIMNSAICNIISSVVLGHRFDYDDPTLVNLSNLVTENLRLIGTPMVNLYNLFPALEFLPGSHKTIIQNINEIHTFLRKKFLKSRRELNCEDKRNYIDAFLVKEQEEKTNPNSYFHETNLISVVTTLFTAGTDTSSATLRWSLALMVKYPHIQRKVQEEIETVIGSEEPSTSHRKMLPYTDAVIHEVQRFASILPLSLPRQTTVDTTFRGYFLPKDTFVIPLLDSVHYDKTQYEKPEEFNPQHFLDSEGKFVKKDAFMPFGAGRRLCIGENLARMQLFLFFTSLLQKFNMCLPPGVSDIDLTPDIGFTIPPVPFELCAIPRS